MQQAQSSRNNTNDGSFTPKLSAILGSFLEVLIHEILYTRSLYPHDAFSPTRHYGVLCHACRHSGVVDYIYDTLKVAIPAIIAGIVEGLYLVFYDEDTDEIYERFALEFQLEDVVEIQAESLKQPYGTSANRPNSTNPMDPSTLERHALHYKIKQLESNLRDVLLRISSLQGTDLGRRRGRSTFSPSTTFKLCLKKLEIEEGREVCPPELEDALQNGKWFSPDDDLCQFSSSNNSFQKPSAKMSDSSHADHLENHVNQCSKKGRNHLGSVVTRPLKSVGIPSCGLSLQMLYEFEPSNME
ncbi:hypothetical protein CTEN210_08923 [Chaetoceros tenuissimus]|uniref:HORMA domain-containing protein n=1 Tax=Chaetoceros tenuissimus TaxID=426638 RepID=A0AAD3CUS3_9STRA|nr:hypothetical protein CTEN210_08923 [Chaetoceros tenuissimus]